MDSQTPISMRLSVPLNALRAFEAAARHLSVKEAALELSVTASAVSHQLRILEDSLGLELMRRNGARLELTETGQMLAPELTAGFSRIVQAVENLRQDRTSGPLRLSMLPTFAVHWLSPRLISYPFDRAGFELLISTTQAPVDLAAGVADAAIRHGKGDWPGLISDLLFDETVTLLAPPRLTEGGETALRKLLGETNLFLSQHRREAFEDWNATLPGGPVRPAAITIVDSAGLALKAAIDGAGITLAGAEIAGADIEAGRLAPLFDHRVAGGGYYLVYPRALERDRRIKNLRQWLISATPGRTR